MRPSRRLLYGTVLLVLVCGVAEVCALVAHRLVMHERFSFAACEAERAAILQNPSRLSFGSDALAGAGWLDQGTAGYGMEHHRKLEVLHPYLGFVVDPAPAPAIVSEQGFRVDGDTTTLSQKTATNFILGIFGGSFAVGLSVHGKTKLIEELQTLPAFRGKTCIVQTIAWGGYKQPQQLLALSYLLSLGATFDLIVNLDGFNEVALPPTENIPNHVNPFYPRLWFSRVNRLYSADTLRTMGRMAAALDRREQWARLFSHSVVRHTVTGNLAWRYYDRALAARYVAQDMLYTASQAQDGTNSYLVSGAKLAFSTDAEMYQALADEWRRCSEQMSKLCAANGIPYFHFLQPNQYVANSKPMSPGEAEIAFRDDAPFRESAQKGYPFLLEAGKVLKNEGVPFHDLTMLFATNAEPLYIDSCCHVNSNGYILVAAAMGRTICDALPR